jgi:tRNA U55 pseudouridine synthase TruB
MAHGVLILLVGDENKQREKYEKLVKEYVFQCIFGIGTDTYDILGMILNIYQSVYSLSLFFFQKFCFFSVIHISYNQMCF